MVAAPIKNKNVGAGLTIVDPNKINGTLEQLLVADLRIDHDYQRTANEVKVKKIANEFDPDIFGVISVSRRRDGSLWVIDGQHRILALRLMGWDDQLVPCIVYEHLLVEDEAMLFYRPQTTRSPLKPGERFKARLMSHDATAMRLAEVIEEEGFHLNWRDYETSGGRLCAIGTLEWINGQYGEATLRVLLRIVREAWSGETSGVTAAVLKGMARFVARYRGNYDHVHLVASLRKAIDPHRIEADGIALKKLIGGTSEDAVGMTVLRVYNYKKTTHRLPDWHDVDPRKQRGKRETVTA